ncbi:MAG TPA: ATP-binding cassette domain-containing protein, partial [Solirubrobacteraceae bacterium]|nr:ATP-binding cassette domain-containing protein [Solirubrobacteraceae bacterium]
MASEKIAQNRTRRRTSATAVERGAAAVARAQEAAPRPSGAPVIDFRGVSKHYPSGDIGLEQVTFSVDREEFVFLVGSTGSGKSTVMRLLIKELEPTAGTISVAGRDLHDIR